MRIHGLVYQLHDGILHDLEIEINSLEQLPEEHRIYWVETNLKLLFMDSIIHQSIHDTFCILLLTGSIWLSSGKLCRQSWRLHHTIFFCWNLFCLMPIIYVYLVIFSRQFAIQRMLSLNVWSFTWMVWTWVFGCSSVEDQNLSYPLFANLIFCLILMLFLYGISPNEKLTLT